ncbi:hypothetical protein EDB84DRAFT_551697 [Lactarius hengduanensis]|nr:hypothetical protein EDB84DRAFT_551697 [Lactarius hengduanensis]
MSATVTITLVLFTFTPCVLWSNIDSLNEVRQVSRYTHIYPDLLHHVSSLSLCVHGHPEFTRLPPRDARRTGRCRYYVHPAQESSTSFCFLQYTVLRRCHSFRQRKVPSTPCDPIRFELEWERVIYEYTPRPGEP